MIANAYSNPGISGGNREDLMDFITIIEPEETPAFSVVRKGIPAKALLHEVVADNLRRPRVSGTAEGAPMPKASNEAANRARFGSYLHRGGAGYAVDDVQLAISKAGGTAGVSNEYDYAKLKAMREVKRDIEAIICSNQETHGGDDQPMLSRGAFQWLNGSGQSPAVPTKFQTPAAQRLTGVAHLVESGANSLNSVLISLKQQYGVKRTFTAFVGTTYEQDMDLMTRTDTVGGSLSQRYRTMQDSEHEISMQVSLFNSSAGRIEFISDLFLRIDQVAAGDPTAALIINPELWDWCELEPLHSWDKDQDEGGMAGFVKFIGGLFCRNPLGNAFIHN